MDHAAFKWFDDYKFSAVIRSGSSDDAEKMIRAAVNGGIKIFEISMQTPQAARLIEQYAKKDGLLFGAGSVSDGEMAQRAINAGAKFLASHYTDKDIVTVAKNNDIFVIQGAFTPTEAFTAYQLGADLVKIYPAGVAGGPEYLKRLRGPLPFVKMSAAGDVTLENAFEYLKYCVSVSLGKGLFDKQLVRSDSWAEITERAKQFTQKLEALKVAR